MTDIDKKVDSVVENKIEPKHVQEVKPSKSKRSGTDNLVLVGLMAVLVYVFAGDYIIDVADDIFAGPEPAELLVPADVQLFLFNDLGSNDSVNVELWIINIGEQIATDIEAYIRVSDQNGTILESKIIPMTAILLRENETCSGTYIIPYTNTTVSITHSVEISWTEGRNSYQRKTILEE